MGIPLKYSTAGQEIPLGYFLDTTDGNTEEISLTIANTDIKLWKSGATALVNKNSGGATHLSNGIYYCTLDATDTNTYGPMVIFIHIAGALTVRLECDVMSIEAYDTLYGTDNLTVDISTGSLTNINAECDTAIANYDPPTRAELTSDIGSVTSQISGLNNFNPASDTVANVTTVGTTTINSDMITEPPTAIQIRTEIDTNSTKLIDILADTNELQTDNIPGLISTLNDVTVSEIWAHVVENGKTAEQFMRIIKAVVAGKTTGNGTAFRDDADSKARVTATLDGNGNRINVITDGA